MVCIILAAGYANRIKSLAFNCPKPLIALDGKSIITKIVENIDEAGRIREFIVVTDHKYASMFHTWARDLSYSCNTPISIIDNYSFPDEEGRASLSDVILGLRNVKNEPVMVVSGENIIDFSIAEFIDYFDQHNTTCVMRYAENSQDSLPICGVIELQDDLIVNILKKPQSSVFYWVVSPFFIYTYDDAMKANQALDDGCETPCGFIQWLYKCSPIHAMKMPGKRYDVDSMGGRHNNMQGWDE